MGTESLSLPPHFTYASFGLLYNNKGLQLKNLQPLNPI